VNSVKSVTFATFVTCFLLVSASASATSFQLTLDTSPLTGAQTFGFGLTNFDSAGNDLSLASFDFGGGAAVTGSDDCTLGGLFNGTGCSGDLATAVTLQDLDSVAFFTQQFDAGSSLSFVLNTSNNFSGSGIPDQLAMYVCDGSFVTCYSNDASGAMLLLDLSGGALSVSQFVTFGATAQGLSAPIVTELTQTPDPTPVPEPGTMLLVGSGLVCVLRRRRLGTGD